MNSIHENDILFDDISVLTQLTDKRNLAITSSNNDCDCGSYTSTTNIEESDTYQVTTSVSKTSR